MKIGFQTLQGGLQEVLLNSDPFSQILSGELVGRFQALPVFSEPGNQCILIQFTAALVETMGPKS